MFGGTTGPRGNRRKGAMVASQNVEIAKKAYEAYGAGDVETALADFDDNIEWSIPGNSAISGDYRGKDQFMPLRNISAAASLAEQDLTVPMTITTARRSRKSRRRRRSPARSHSVQWPRLIRRA